MIQPKPRRRSPSSLGAALLVSASSLFHLSCGEHRSQLLEWSFAPCMYKFESPGEGADFLPQNDYQGESAPSFSHNIMHDCDGALLFFLVDGVVYDSEGLFVFDLSTWWNRPIDAPEIVVLPMPGEPTHYLFVGGNRSAVDSSDSGPKVFYAIIDVALRGLKPPQPPIVRFESLNPNDDLFGGPGCHTLHFAAPPAPSDPSLPHFIYISGCGTLHRYKLSSGALVPDEAFKRTVDDASRSTLLTAEMEIVEVGGEYLIAFPYESNQGGADFVRVVVTDDQGEVQTERSINVDDGHPEGSITGLEFSPGGEILWVSHTEMGVGYVDPLEGDKPVPLLSEHSGDLGRSQIEMAVDGSLYIGGDRGLFRLASPASPEGASWEWVTNEGPHMGPMLGTRQMNDQIDGYDYSCFTQPRGTATPQ